jgi:hypothetical protein
VYNVGYYTPDLEFGLLVDLAAAVLVVLRYERHLIPAYADSLDGKLTIDYGYNNVLVSRLDTAVDDE